ncbi:MAG TPA: LuxR C-terminal-related transcriptional regulator [Anaerolineae bacterium]|nr:LuxR C-terminal-related transcriptional regulator [Anaerolineae bacterium]
MVAAAGLNQFQGDGEEALQIAREIGWRAGEAYALTTLAYLRGACGQYGSALDAARLAAEIAAEIEHREWLIRAYVALAAIYLDVFAPADARKQLELAEPLAQASGSQLWLHAVAAFMASADIAEKDFAHAKQVLKRVLGSEVSGHAMGERIAWCVRAELALAEGDLDLALEIAERLITAAPNASEQRVIPRLWKLRGQARTRTKSFVQAEADLIAARGAASEQAARPLLWRVHLALGQVYQARRERGRAEQEFSAARAIIAELAESITEPGLREHFLNGAAAELPRLPLLTPRRAAQREFAGLTERERQVAALIAEGKSNREIAQALVLSEYTAATHVANILNKLGFRSRAQIAGWAIAKGLVKPGAQSADGSP